MLLYLLYSVLQRYFHALNVFRYITVRTALASLTALLIELVLGPWVIRRLRELQIGQFIREEGPKSHQSKAGTPTMGGILIVGSTVIPTLLWGDLGNEHRRPAYGRLSRDRARPDWLLQIEQAAGLSVQLRPAREQHARAPRLARRRQEHPARTLDRRHARGALCAQLP